MIEIRNKCINIPILQILSTAKQELINGKLNSIIEKGDEIIISCPHHKNGQEKHPSCHVYCGKDNKVPEGTCHCFSCGFSSNLQGLIGEIFDEDSEFGEQWLLNRFVTGFIIKKQYLPEITFEQKKKKEYLNEQDLLKFAFYHPYMWKRKMSKEIVDKFKVGYDKDSDCITFPIWDEKGNLVMVTKRSVKNKYFFIPDSTEKPIYGLNFILKENIPTVYVVESQINCLVSWSYGYPAIGLLGTGSSEQYQILNKSPIRNYILLFDGDSAGRKGAERFKKNIRKDVFVTDIQMYEGKDVADLSKQELEELLGNSKNIAQNI